MVDNNDGRVREKTLQDILNMTIKLSDQEAKELKPTEMEEERKVFLNRAIEHTLENDDAKKLALFTAKFLEYKADEINSEDQLAELSNLFEGLNFLLEGMDMGNNFNNLGGLKHCLALLRSDYSSLQWKAADTIANCVQNIPKNQDSVIEDKGFEVLLYVLKKTDVDMVRVKCLYALSCLIGGNTVAEKLFVDLKGVDVILKFLTDDNPKIRLKSAFLVRKLIWSETVKFIDNKVDIALQLIQLIKMEHDDSHEVVADVLLNLVEIDENTLNECKKLKDDLNVLFNSRKKDLHDIDAEKYEELIEIYVKLLKLL